MKDEGWGRGERLNRDTEDLLWRLSQLPARDSRRPSKKPVDDATIDRYRRGEMTAREARRFEIRAANDQGALERMAHLGERAAVRRRSRWIAASILVFGIATAGLFYGLRSGDVDPTSGQLPSYAVTVEGISERRGATPETTYRAAIGSTVRIVARPAVSVAAEPTFALYREGTEGWVRVPDEALRVDVSRGTAVLEAEASRLVGSEPGLFRLVLLIGNRGLNLPATFGSDRLDELASGEAVQAQTFELLLRSGSLAPARLSWEFYPEPCPQADSLYSQSCGAYGELHFEVASSRCRAFDSGAERSFSYAAELGAARPDASRPATHGFATGFGLPTEPPATGPWSALIDWRDAHGFAAGSVSDAVSGDGIPTVAYYLDAPDLRALGEEIGDQHLLAKLCEVADAVDTDGAHGLTTLGLSLGRLQQAEDPPAGGSCQGTLACQIERVLGHLREQGVHIVAAAGNHRELLFPAVLDEALAVGALDFGEYLATGAQRPAWETPAGSDALLPGHALCVDGTTAPSGSSLSTALFAGGLARLIEELPGIDPYADGPWTTRWSERENCMVLAQGDLEHPLCNPAIESVLGGVMRGDSSGCWDVADPARIATAASPQATDFEPTAPALPLWVANRLSKTPEEDPCIPCTDDDSYPPFQADLFLNLTRSMPLPSEVHLDRLYLRTGASFYEIELEPRDLRRFAEARLDGLRLPGFAALLESGGNPSLYYLLKVDPALDCTDAADAGRCFWSSTYVLP